MDTYLAAFPATAAVSFLAFREGWRAWQPTRHLLAGDYELAKESAEMLSQSWLRFVPGVRASTRYAVAASLHFLGRLEESLAASSDIDRTRLSRATRFDFDSLDAANLVLLDREPDRAIALLANATAAEDLALLALARQAKGLPSSVPERVPTDGDHASVYHYLSGLHALRAGQTSIATKSFRLAADAPHQNVYTHRARAYFDGPATDDGPGSLAPQVVATDATDALPPRA